MTILSFDPNAVRILAGELKAGFIFKPDAYDHPSLLIRRFLPPQGRVTPEKL